MKQDSFEHIKSELEMHDLNEREKQVDYDGLFIGKQKISARPAYESGYLQDSSLEEFNKIIATFKAPKETGVCNIYSPIESLPHPHHSRIGHLFSSERLSEQFDIEYYAGKSVNEATFMALTYSLEFYYNPKLKEALAKSSERELNDLHQIVQKFWDIGSFNPLIYGKKYSKELVQGVTNPFWDEYSRPEEATYIMSMRFFEQGANTSAFSKFLFYAHERVLRLDNIIATQYIQSGNINNSLTR